MPPSQSSKLISLAVRSCFLGYQVTQYIFLPTFYQYLRQKPKADNNAYSELRIDGFLMAQSMYLDGTYIINPGTYIERGPHLTHFIKT